MSDFLWPRYTVHGILQARILEKVSIPFSRRSSQPRDWTQVFHIASRFFTVWATMEALRRKYRVKSWLWIWQWTLTEDIRSLTHNKTYLSWTLMCQPAQRHSLFGDVYLWEFPGPQQKLRKEEIASNRLSHWGFGFFVNIYSLVILMHFSKFVKRLAHIYTQQFKILPSKLRFLTYQNQNA